MKELITYFIGVVVCSGVLTALYSLLLERRVRFAVCRAYLLAAMALAALIPAVKIPVWAGEVVYAGTAQVSAGGITAEIVDSPAPTITPQALCAAVWALGTLLLLGVMVLQFIRMRRFRREAAEADFGEYKVVRVKDKISSFSFFRTIFIGADTPAEDLQVIIAHEAGHIRHRHSAERVAMEVLKALLWWNPFVWIAARRLTEVHEYEADSDVLRNGCDIDWYINTLLKNLFGYSPDIANGLRNSLTKKRLKMMTNKKNGRYALLRMAAIVPVVAGLVATFSFTTRAATIETMPEPAMRRQSNTIIISGNGTHTSTDSSSMFSATGVKDVLIIVDGEVFEGNLEDIDADTIENMTILKGDSATAAYGEKGANGVIIIKTKRGGEDALLRAQQMPTFNGGDLHSFREWVMRNVRFPQEALEKGIYGRVVASFVIDKEGKLGNITTLTSPDPLLSQEFERVLSSSPVWEPGRNGGEAVDVKYTLYVDFNISDGTDIKREDAPAPADPVRQISVIGFTPQN